MTKSTENFFETILSTY